MFSGTLCPDTLAAEFRNYPMPVIATTWHTGWPGWKTLITESDTSGKYILSLSRYHSALQDRSYR